MATQTIEFKDAAARAAQAVQAGGSNSSDELLDLHGDKLVLNMGPSHPSTHGVLRIVIELDGETITKAIPDVGYLHRGDEKIAENMTYNQFVPYTDRLDYLAPLANNVAYALAVEKLMGIDTQLPPRCQYLRVVCCELARISAHLLGLGAFAMDVGALTVFLHTFTEREKIYNLCESLTGARFTTSYTRIGGMTRDCPPGWVAAVRKFLDEVVVNFDESETLLTRNRIFVDRTRDVGVISKELAIDYGLTGPPICAAAASITTSARPIRTSSTRTSTSTSRSVRWAIPTTGTWFAWKRCARACASSASASTACLAAPTMPARSPSMWPTARSSCRPRTR